MKARTLGGDLLVLFVSVGGLAGVLKFSAFLNHWVYFPSWPNVLDLALLAVNCGGLLGLYVGIRRLKKKTLVSPDSSS